MVEFARQRGLSVCPRGSGYSYADMILNDGEIVLDTGRMNRILAWDETTGRLAVEPGVVFAEILRTTLLANWTLPSCVGGMGVTVGGGVSNDVHGKDSWKVGNFGDHVVELKLLTARGEVLRVTREEHEDLFRAVVAGAGLLGVIVEVTLQLRQVTSPFVEVTVAPTRSLAESLDVMERERERSDFLIAWVDAFPGGRRLGRGTVETARWIERPGRVEPAKLDASLVVPGRVFGWLPAKLAWRLGRPVFGPGLIRAVNAVRHASWRLRGQQRSEALFTDYNFMLNKIPGWKELYRPHGYLEFQPMVPREGGLATLSHLLQLCRTEGMQSLLCAVKPHRPDDSFLSYAGDGYSIGIDIALRGRTRQSVKDFARTLYTYVADVGGTTFLAKDEMLPRDLFERMYPHHKEFLRIKQQVDPDAVFASDMYRRLLA